MEWPLANLQGPVKVAHNRERCKKDPSYRDILNQIRSKREHIADWDESVNNTEPACTDECKRLIMNTSKTHDTDHIMLW